MSVCRDSWAILAWLDGEEPALSRVDARPVVSGDCSALATAAAHAATLLTGDPEILELADPVCPVEDLRA